MNSFSAALYAGLLGGTAVLSGFNTEPPKNDPSTPPRQDPPVNQPNKTDDQTTRDNMRSMQPVAPRFEFAEKIIGMDLHSSSGEDLGDVNDILIQRGSGRVEFFLVKPSKLSGRQVTVSASSVRWDTTQKQLMTDGQLDSLERQPWWDDKSWGTSKGTDGNPDSTDKQQSRDDQTQSFPSYYESYSKQRSRYANPYGTNYDLSKSTSLDGQVERIERRSNGMYDDQVVMTLVTPEGKRQVWIGPSWYVSGAPTWPYRGQKVRVTAVPGSPNWDNGAGTAASSNSYIGTQLTYPNGTYVGWNPSGPAWLGSDYTVGARRYSSAYYQLVRYSDIADAKLQCGAEQMNDSCGSVEDVVIDLANQRAAFVAVDPDEKFLDIGEEDRLVPWNAIWIGLDGTVRIDASKEMIKSAPKVPDDPHDMNTSYRSVYSTYDTANPYDDR